MATSELIGAQRGLLCPVGAAQPCLRAAGLRLCLAVCAAVPVVRIQQPDHVRSGGQLVPGTKASNPERRRTGLSI